MLNQSLVKRKWGDREGGSRRWPGYVMSTKVIFRRAEVFVLGEVCLPRRPHAVLPRSQVLSEKRKWWRTWKAYEYIFFLSNIGPRLACMRTSRKTSARLKITFVDMTYPKGWTGSLLLCPLIFSWFSRCWMSLNVFKLCFNNHSTFLFVIANVTVNEVEAICPLFQHCWVCACELIGLSMSVSIVTTAAEAWDCTPSLSWSFVECVETICPPK